MRTSDLPSDSIQRYLDFINPLAPTARQAAKRIAMAPEDQKLTVFEDVFATLCDKVVVWVREGFWMFLNTKNPSPAENRLREFLEHRLGHQIEYPGLAPVHYVPINPWLEPSEPAYKTIVWWVAESVGEGYQISTPPGGEPPEDMTEELYQQLEPLDEMELQAIREGRFEIEVREAEPSDPPQTDAEMLADTDAASAALWGPPSWLWRILPVYGIKPPHPHTHETAKTELAYMHYNLWEAIEDAIIAAKLHAQATPNLTPAGTTEEQKPLRARPQINPDYERTYKIVTSLDLKYEGRPKLGEDSLKRICEAHDAKGYPFPNGCSWNATTWTEALRNEHDRVKGWISNAVFRHHNVLAKLRCKKV